MWLETCLLPNLGVYNDPSSLLHVTVTIHKHVTDPVSVPQHRDRTRILLDRLDKSRSPSRNHQVYVLRVLQQIRNLGREREGVSDGGRGKELAVELAMEGEGKS